MRKTITAISKFYEQELDYLIVLPEALTQRFAQIENFKTIKISKSQTIDIETLTKQLILMGYTRQNIVTSQGEFSVRGDILDIFVLENDHPVRIDFFGDDIENIYTFNLEDMNKIANIEELKVYPNTIYFRQEPYSIIDELQDYQKNIKN